MDWRQGFIQNLQTQMNQLYKNEKAIADMGYTNNVRIAALSRIVKEMFPSITQETLDKYCEEEMEERKRLEAERKKKEAEARAELDKVMEEQNLKREKELDKPPEEHTVEGPPKRPATANALDGEGTPEEVGLDAPPKTGEPKERPLVFGGDFTEEENVVR